MLFVLFILLSICFLTGCQGILEQEKPVTEERIHQKIKEFAAHDARNRFSAMYYMNIDPLSQGKWELESIDENEAYVLYVSPYILYVSPTVQQSNGKEVYMVLEYHIDKETSLKFVGYKFFDASEDYRDNHR